MMWNSTDRPNVRTAEFMGWVVTETFMYVDAKTGRRCCEYLATQGDKHIKSCSWSWIKKKLSVQQLKLFQ